MEKRQDTDRARTDRMTELSQVVVSSPSITSKDGATKECDGVTADAEEAFLEDELAAEAEALAAENLETANEVVEVTVTSSEEDCMSDDEPEADVPDADVPDAGARDVEASNAEVDEPLVDSQIVASNTNVEVAVVAKAVEERAIVEDEALGPQERLGRSLRDKRDELSIGLDEIARTTKIPKTSLAHIEAGRFDSLPGDVFARGFLRSYARCVGMDGDDVVRRYAQCGLNPAPVSSALADAVLGGRRKSSSRHARGTTPAKPKAAASTATEAPAATRAADASPETGSADGNAVRKVLRDAFDLGLQVRSGLARNAPKENTEAVSKADRVVADRIAVEEAAPAECKSVREKRTRTFVPPAFDYENDMTHRGPLTLGVIILVIVATLTMSYLLRRPGTSTDGFTMNAPSMIDMPSSDSQSVGALQDALASNPASNRAERV